MTGVSVSKTSIDILMLFLILIILLSKLHKVIQTKATYVFKFCLDNKDMWFLDESSFI